MNIDRSKILAKIRALFSKTVDNGCTEAEALMALDKARQMMDAYEVTPEDIEMKGEAAATFVARNDPNAIKSSLCTAIALFADCKVWRERDKVGIKFCGMPADIELAGWLLDTLSKFVLRELGTHLMFTMATPGQRRHTINGFVAGCCGRINERLRALAKQSAEHASGNSRALVVAKGALVAAHMATLGLNLSKARRSTRRGDGGAYTAGQSAGDRASLGRPVSGSGAVRAIAH